MAASLFPDRSEPYQNQGIILREQSRFDEAAAAFAKAVELAPRSASPIGLLWWLQVGPVRDATGAEASALKLVALRPDDPGAMHTLAWSYVAQQRMDDARAELERIVARHPDFSRARINLAHVTLKAGRAADAAEQYRGILDDARAGDLPMTPPATASLWLAIALQRAGRPSEAMSPFDEAYRGAQGRLGQALVDAARGRAEDARGALDTVPPLEMEKLDYDTARTLAAVYAGLGDVDNALAALARALELNAWDVYYNLIVPEYSPLWGDPRFSSLIATKR
jgi:tetratricopeptide (TPR) repeat protein